MSWRVLVNGTSAGVVCDGCAKTEGEAGGEVSKVLFNATPGVPIACGCGAVIDTGVLPEAWPIDLCISPLFPENHIQALLKTIGDLPGVEAALIHLPSAKGS